MELSLGSILEARERLRGIARRTNLVECRSLSDGKRRVFLKTEDLQDTGSFKVRGAYIKIASLSEEERKAGVIASSAGNHAQGVALARAMLAMMASNVGNDELKCRAIAEVTEKGMSNQDYALLNAYARQMMAHHADLAWTKQQGHRAPFGTLSCPDAAAKADVTMSDSDIDDLLSDEE